VRSRKIKKIKMSFYPQLNESPDRICMTNVNYKYAKGKYVDCGYDCQNKDDEKGCYNDLDSRSFGYHKEKSKIGRNKIGEIWVGGERETHKPNRLHFKYPGRIWFKRGIISFWEYPPPDKLENIINEIIEKIKEVNDPIKNSITHDFLDNLIIEIIKNSTPDPFDADWDKNDNDEEAVDISWEGIVETEYIRVKDYKYLTNIIQPNKDALFQDHRKSPMDPSKKKKEISKNFGSPLTAWDSINNIKKRQSERTSESFYPQL